MLNLPTAPANPAGAPAGRGRTCTNTVSLFREAFSPAAPTDTLKAAGSIATIPTTVGNSTVRNSTTLYSLEFTVDVYSSCLTFWLFQNPAKAGDSYLTCPEPSVAPAAWYMVNT